MRDWTILESRVDWITATASIGEGGHELLTVGQDLVYAESLGGGVKRDWYWQGYQGCQCEHSSTGWRLDGAIVRLGGAIAGLHWLRAASSASRITRLDICVTATCGPPFTDLASQGFEVCTSSLSQKRRQREFTLLRAASGGSTLYSGKRSSERFGRLYEKSYESNGEWPRGTWRWEWEYKGDLAAGTAEELKRSSDVPRTCLGLVCNEQERVGYALPFPCTIEIPVKQAKPNGLTEAERRMKWLQTSVAPAIEKLAVSYTEEEVLNALGMWYPTAPPVTGPDNGDLGPLARKFLQAKQRERASELEGKSEKQRD